MQYIPWVLTTISILVTLYLAFHKESKEDQEKDNKEEKALAVSFAKMDVKMDAMLSSVNEVRLDQKNQSTRISTLERDMAIVQQSTKSAHHRLDDMIAQAGIKENRGNYE